MNNAFNVLKDKASKMSARCKIYGNHHQENIAVFWQEDSRTQKRCRRK